MDNIAERVTALSPEKRALLILWLRGRALDRSISKIAPRAKTSDRIPLSFAQQRLYFLDVYEPGDPSYNVPAALRFAGRLDVQALESSLTEIVRRHEAFRTTFAVYDGQPTQVVCEPKPIELVRMDLGTLPEEAREARARELAAAEAQMPFDLRQGPLFRSSLVRIAEQDHLLLLTMHHIISDGESLIILTRELAAFYNAFSEGKPSPLFDLPIQYGDFAVWQHESLCGETPDHQLAYWKNKLGNAPPLLDLPTDRPRLAERSYRGAAERIELSADLVKSLKELSRREQATLFMTLVAAFKALLCRLSGMEDVVVASGVSGRQPETEDVIGLFVNTLVLRTDLSGNPTFREIVYRVREVVLEGMAHKDIPFEKVVKELRPERDPSFNPIFQVMFSLQVVPPGGMEFSGIEVKSLEYEFGMAKFDLILSLFETQDSISGYFEYSKDLFEAQTIARMLGYYGKLLDDIAAFPERRLFDLQIDGNIATSSDWKVRSDDVIEQFDFQY